MCSFLLFNLLLTVLFYKKEQKIGIDMKIIYVYLVLLIFNVIK